MDNLANNCHYQRPSSPFKCHTEAHATLFMAHFLKLAPELCNALSLTPTITEAMVRKGDAASTLVEIKDDPKLENEEGLYFTQDVSKDTSVCQYFGNMCMKGAAAEREGTYSFTFNEEKLKNSPLYYEGIHDCKARRINSYDVKNVTYEPDWNDETGFSLMVKTSKDVKKGDPLSADYGTSFVWDGTPKK